MTSTLSPPTQPIPAQTLLADRYILTQVERFTLVFPAVWVAEIIRLDRSQVLDLPFYNPLLVGIVNHNARITPLIAAARLLDTTEPFNLKDRLMVIRLNEAAGKIANVGIVVDRAIGGSTRQELPPELFEPSQITTETVLMCPELIPSNLWQPQRWG
jgi:chemotaxis signal transduction protein